MSLEDSHLEYLHRMFKREVVSELVAQTAIQLWFYLRVTLGKLPIPAAIAESCEIDHYWSNGIHYCNIIVLQDGSFEWHVGDRILKSFDGGEVQSTNQLPQKVFDTLKLISEQP